jgi:hypothetical protein
MSWRLLGASVVGAGHEVRGAGCDDAHAVASTRDGALLLIAVADGAGSAARGGDGARVAVQTALEHGDPADAFEAAAAALEADMATTLTVVHVGADTVTVAQVGDGAVVLRRGDVLEVVGPVEREEFLNETVFLTSTSWRDHLRVDVVPADGVDAVAVLTDGLQLLAFELPSGRPHDPFFTPLYSYAAADDSTVEELSAFLASERVCARTDDDKTLVLAVRT